MPFELLIRIVLDPILFMDGQRILFCFYCIAIDPNSRKIASELILGRFGPAIFQHGKAVSYRK